MELLMRTLEVAPRAQQVPLGLSRKGDVRRGGACATADIDQCVGKGAADRFRLGPGASQEPASGSRRERDRDLQFGIIGAPGALICLRPAVVEYVLPT